MEKVQADEVVFVADQVPVWRIAMEDLRSYQEYESAEGGKDHQGAHLVQHIGLQMKQERLICCIRMANEKSNQNLGVIGPQIFARSH